MSSTPKSLEGRTIVVTGGSMGIGYACAEEILARGGRVFLVARGKPDLESAADRLGRNAKDVVSWMAADVANEDDVRRIFDGADAFGEVSGVVHSAGIYGPIGAVVDVDAAAWLDTVRVNLFGSFLVAREACKRFIKNGTKGSLVLLAGGGAASPFPRYTAYASAKAGVVRLTETLALEVAEHGIRVNCIAPGFVATLLHEQTLAAGEAAAGDFFATTQARLSEGSVSPAVAARTVAFLLSSESEAITGRFVAAPYDDWEHWPEHLDEIIGSDLFTLRRIVPRDRGKDWQ